MHPLRKNNLGYSPWIKLPPLSFRSNCSDISRFILFFKKGNPHQQFIFRAIRNWRIQNIPRIFLIQTLIGENSLLTRARSFQPKISLKCILLLRSTQLCKKFLHLLISVYKFREPLTILFSSRGAFNKNQLLLWLTRHQINGIDSQICFIFRVPDIHPLGNLLHMQVFISFAMSSVANFPVLLLVPVAADLFAISSTLKRFFCFCFSLLVAQKRTAMFTPQSCRPVFLRTPSTFCLSKALNCFWFPLRSREIWGSMGPRSFRYSKVLTYWISSQSS